MKRVVIGLLGTTLDNPGRSRNRLERWRPTVDICRHKSLKVDRLELIHPPSWDRLAKTVKADIESISPKTKVNLHALATDNPWDFEEMFSTLYDFASGYSFKPDKEEYLVHITTGTHVAQICLFLLTESRHLPAQLIQSSPPPKGKPKSQPGSYTIIDLDLAQYDQIAQRFITEKEESLAVLKSGIETRNKAFNRLIEQIERVAIASTEPMLLMGPTGAGKSQLAGRIFELKKHRGQVNGQFVSVNCATLRGDNAMSALFGHIRGAYTGADKPRDGLLKTADGGCLFLDEIGELGLDEQAMLLSAIETGRYMPLGSDKEVSSNFLLIVGTNRDLRDRVTEGFFREDLLARINLWSFRLPGLAERREDIEPNLEYELDRWTEKTGTRVTFNAESRDKYLRFARSKRASWNGNFRDLNASLTRMATLAPQGRIDVETVEEEMSRLKEEWRVPQGKADGSTLQGIMPQRSIAELDLFDRVQLEAAVEVCLDSTSLADAGRALFAQSRQKRATPNDSDRLRKYLQKFGLSWKAIREA